MIIKPWGGFVVNYEAPDKSVCQKTLFINPGEEISVQFHDKRAEFWYIHDDDAHFKFLLESKYSEHKGKTYLVIPISNIHWVKNIGEKVLVIQETQFGFCDDADIVRLSDHYANER